MLDFGIRITPTCQRTNEFEEVGLESQEHDVVHPWLTVAFVNQDRRKEEPLAGSFPRGSHRSARHKGRPFRGRARGSCQTFPEAGS